MDESKMDVVEDHKEQSNEIKEEELEDEYKVAFESLESGSSSHNQGNVQDYEIMLKNPRIDEVAVKIKELCIYRLARLYTKEKKIDEIISLLKNNGEFFSIIPKAKTAKIVRSILNIIATIPDSLDVQVIFCRDIVEWCKLEKRTFLRQRIEAKLASLLLQQKKPSAALEIVDNLLKELKKLDDKQMLTETHLTESRIYHSLQNIPKSKASLTASRTAANAIYVVPLLQAEIDEMSGILHCEESDYTTAYSYFLEAFDAYDQASGDIGTTSAVNCIKYMILCKILKEAASDVPALLSSKIGLKHSGEDLEAMSAIAKAAKIRSLGDFQLAVQRYEKYLRSDDLIAHHLDILYDKMLESNLLKIIHLFSCVEITHVADLIKLPEEQVIKKLSQMILDQKLPGILDQGKGHLIIYDVSEQDNGFSKGLNVISNMGVAVETLFTRAKTLGLKSSS